MLGDMTNKPVEYLLHELTEASNSLFDSKLNQLKALDYQGVNVTYPFKRYAASIADEKDNIVNVIGACNTLRFENRKKLIATNTDYTGFIKAYRQHMGNKAPGIVLQIGAGGVGCATAYALKELNAEKLYIYDIDSQAANLLTNSVTKIGLETVAITKDKLEHIAMAANGIINATPIGHYQTPGTPIRLDLLSSQRWTFDAVYTPIETDFIKACRSHDITAISGLDLFFYQGVDAFEFFTGVKTTPDQVRPGFYKNSGLLNYL